MGCGNGKYFSVRPDLTVLGSDRSTGLALQAMKLCKLPFKQKELLQSTQQAPTCSILPDIAASSMSEATPSEQRRALCSPSAKSQVPGDGEVEYRESFREGRSGQGPGSCMLGRAHMQACPRADVLVADAMQLPYKVWLFIRRNVT